MTLQAEWNQILCLTGRTDRRISEVSMPICFTALRLRYHPTSFRNLMNISQTPGLSCHVVSIAYNGVILQDASRDEWLENIHLPTSASLPKCPENPSKSLTKKVADSYLKSVKDWVEKCKPPNFYTPAQIQAGYQAFLEQRRGVCSLKDNYLDFIVLVSSFTRFPKLEKLYLFTNPRKGEYPPKRDTHLLTWLHLAFWRYQRVSMMIVGWRRYVSAKMEACFLQFVRRLRSFVCSKSVKQCGQRYVTIL